MGQLDASIEPAVPGLYAIVSEPVRAVEVSAPAAAKRGDEVQFALTVATGGAYRSVARVEMLNPDGRAVAYYGRNEDTVDGRATFRFRPALNDTPGRWKIVVTDVISGRSATAEFRLL